MAFTKEQFRALAKKFDLTDDKAIELEKEIFNDKPTTNNSTTDPEPEPENDFLKQLSELRGEVLNLKNILEEKSETNPIVPVEPKKEEQKKSILERILGL